MGRLLKRMGLPLLTKELIEQAARRRTWVLRTVYLACVFTFCMLITADRWNTNHLFSVLGTGGRIFDLLIGIQFFGVYLLVPLVSFGLITAEKERDSLQLLILTRLTPGTILIEKLLSRLVPLALFLIATLPLLAAAYSYGGVSTPMLANAVLCLVTTGFYLASIALCVSTLAATSVSAFFWTLAAGAAVTIGPVFLTWMVWDLLDLRHSDLWPGFEPENSMMLMGPYVFYEREDQTFYECLLRNVPQLVAGVVCLVTARLAMPRVSLSGRTTFRRRIRQFVESVFGKIIPQASKQSLPDQAPITWVELRHGLLSRPLYLVLQLVIVGGLAFAGILIAFSSGSRHDVAEFSIFCHSVLWIAGPLMICGRASTLFGTERSRQTLDVLLTTPTTTRDILRQKMASVWSLIIYLLIMFGLISAVNAVAGAHYDNSRHSVLIVIPATMITAAIYLPMLAWMSMAYSLRVKTAGRATVFSVVTLVVWCIGPPVFCVMCMMFGSGPGNEEGFFAFVMPVLTPAMTPIINIIAFFDDDPLDEWYPVSVIWNSILYGAVLAAFRWYCLENASEALDRLDRDSEPARNHS